MRKMTKMKRVKNNNSFLSTVSRGDPPPCNPSSTSSTSVSHQRYHPLRVRYQRQFPTQQICHCHENSSTASSIDDNCCPSSIVNRFKRQKMQLIFLKCILFIVVTSLPLCATQDITSSSLLSPLPLPLPFPPLPSPPNIPTNVVQSNVIRDYHTWRREQSPLIFYDNVIVQQNARLVIEPGVQVQFAPRKGLFVYGTLIALGSLHERIHLTRVGDRGLRENVITPLVTPLTISDSLTGVNWPDVRLVDGDLPSEGRLQIKVSGIWHSVCTNSKNWTVADIKVVCNQLGFEDGNWYQWFTRFNDSRQLMLERPSCLGTEDNLINCKEWSSRQIGSGVCDYHAHIGIRCARQLKGSSYSEGSFWSGIQFIEADSHEEYKGDFDHKLKTRVSNSILNSVDITYAGESHIGESSPAILSIGVPPNIFDSRIRWSAGTGINLTDVTVPTTISQIVSSENRGYGIFINSSWGQVTLHNAIVERNGADGIRYNLQTDLQTGERFCSTANLGDNQVYPIRFTHDQKSDSKARGRCCQEFKIRNRENINAQLTAHFPFIMSGLFEGPDHLRHEASDGFIEVFDGYKKQLVSRFILKNDTRIPSVTSTQSRLLICYHHAVYKKVLFTVVVVADNGRAYDLNITGSTITGNNGRGVWIQNQRSGSVLNHTIVSHHSYVSGLYVNSTGGGDVIVNNTKIINNDGDGVNITLSGHGLTHFDRSTFSSNSGRGIAVFFNESSPLAFMQTTTMKTQVTYSDISLNGGVGFLLGNVCRSDSFVNISMSKFTANKEDSIELRSCLDKSASNHSSILLITHNEFRDNHRLAIRLSPVVRVRKCLISHNNFLLHSKGVILINNMEDLRDDSYYESLEANVEVSDNMMQENSGLFVASLGLIEESGSQSLLFTRNRIENNDIREGFPGLNPRSRVAAVVVITSSNVQVIRNNLVNPASKYEIGVHLESHAQVINGSFNFFGTISQQERTHEIYDRIFDRKNRYNLAQVEFLQYRTTPYDLNTNELLSIDRERDKFTPFRYGQTLGGEVRGDMILERGDYTVVRDVFVRPGSRLVFERGVTLAFDQSVGLMVQGKLESNGHSSYPVRLTGSGTITQSSNLVPDVPNRRYPEIDRPRPTTTFRRQNETSSWFIPSTLNKKSTDSFHTPSETFFSDQKANFNNSSNNFSSPFLIVKESQTTPNPAINFESHVALPPLQNVTLLNETSENSFLPTPVSSRFTRVKRADDLTAGSAKVRLSRGTYGRLEVFLNGEWGGVCAYGFDIRDAAVACQQLGLVLNSRDWLLEKSDYKVEGFVDLRVILTNVQCTSLDTDITECKSEKKDAFDSSCPEDVGIKCYRPSWSGIRLGMSAQPSIIENTIIDNAGLYDYATYKFRPALQVDFHRHKLTNISVKANLDTGIGFNWHDIFATEREPLQLFASDVSDNNHHGIDTRSQGLRASLCDISGNLGAGIHYNPVFSRRHQQDLISWVIPDGRDAIIHIPSRDSTALFSQPSQPSTTFGRSPFSSDTFPRQNPPSRETFSKFNGKELFLDPDRRNFWYIKVDRNPPIDFNDTFILRTKVEHGLGVMVLNPIFSDATDQLIISNEAIPIEWDLKRNLTAFPLMNYAYKLKVTYSSGSNPKGGILLYVAVKRLPYPYQAYDLVLKEIEENKEMKTIFIHDCKLRSNGRGIVSHHYNRDIGQRDEYYLRHSNETIVVANSVIDGSLKEAVFVNSPFYDPLEFSLAEVNFTMVRNRLSGNRKGIVQYSRDIRNSNNIFHWTINDTIVTETTGAGVFLRLPYVWQFNENFTHTVQVHRNIFFKNNNFAFIVDGHFARLNMSHNEFRENLCSQGLITISGMEKEMRIYENVMERNYGHFVVDFDIHSHAEKLGFVEALFRGNKLLSNRDSIPSSTQNLYHPQSYAVALRGVQAINITRNLLRNENLQFEFLAGVPTGSLENRVNVEENWWGSANASFIRTRIFDFDDWNSYAVADFSPFLADESLDAVSIPSDLTPTFIDYSYHFGGRVHKSFSLNRRPTPYVVNSDLTIMPDARLVLGPGVEMEFYPSVGILVLGELIVAGRDNEPVVFRPHRMRDERFRFKREIDFEYNFKQDASDLTDVRLCITESCKEWYPSNKRRDGFLEVYNKTTQQWMPVCDQRFTERNAQVACRQLGFSSMNVYLNRGKRTDMGPTLISRVRFWPEPLECTGKEDMIGQCDVRLNGYGNHTHACKHDGENFIYIFCGEERLNKIDQYWGGIRFASSSFEYTSTSSHVPRPSYSGSNSKIQHAHIIGAGILHGEKNAAIQMINKDVNLEFVNVSLSASHGVEAIAPSGHLRLHGLHISDNLGSGLNFILLGGGSSSQPIVPYAPLKETNLPYNVYGLVNICDLNKHMAVDERILLYYKYDNRPVDCVKIIRPSQENKQIGFRIIQFNLFNSSSFSAFTDVIQLYDGDIFNLTSVLVGDLGVTEEHRRKRPETKFYSSTLATMSIRLHASGASEVHGFVAEVVTLPVSYFLGRGFDHNITYSEVSRNVNGAITYRSAGETSPTVSAHFNRFEDNCLKLYENFTTCPAAVNLQLQNTQHFIFNNNLLRRNQGGLRLETNAQTAAASLHGLLQNNLFDSNFNNEALYVKGSETGYTYELVEILRNYFTLNWAEYKSTVVLSQVMANFTHNMVVSNTGKHQLEVKGFSRIPISYQTVRGNWFYNNYALHINERSTIYASSAGQHYIDNYFVNPDNDFELATMNRSCLNHMCTREQQEKERDRDRRSSVDAKNNWWGFNETSAITSRILDGNDYPDLVRVEFSPFHSSNTTVLSGICSGGWEKIGHTCFTYVGARMSFGDAKRFCESQNSTMPFVRVNQYELTRFLQSQQYNYDYRFFRVWVQSFDYDLSHCTTLVDRRVLSYRCDEELTFLCEKDPDIHVAIDFWYQEPIGIAVVCVSAVTAFILLCCISCWLCKSKEKAKEKLQRRNSIRASIRSNRSLHASMASSINDIVYKRQQMEGGVGLGSVFPSSGVQVYPRGTPQPIQLTNFGPAYAPARGKIGSVESFADSSLRQPPMPSSRSRPSASPSSPLVDSGFESTPANQRRQQPGSVYRPLEDRFADDPGLENANVDLMIRPTFDLTFENEAFRSEVTPSASRASGEVIEYRDEREWAPATVSMSPVGQPTRPTRPIRPAPPVLPKRQAIPPPSPSIASVGQSSRVSPVHPTFNPYETTGTMRTYDRISQGGTLSTFGRQVSPPRLIPPQLPPARIPQSKSQASLLDTAASDITAVTTRTKQSQYLETSLDGESARDNNYDYCDYHYRPDSVSLSTVSSEQATDQRQREQPLETAM